MSYISLESKDQNNYPNIIAKIKSLTTECFAGGIAGCIYSKGSCIIYIKTETAFPGDNRNKLAQLENNANSIVAYFIAERTSNQLEIWSVCTASSKRGQGHMRGLFGAAMIVFKKMNIPIILYVDYDNVNWESVVKFYARNGFSTPTNVVGLDNNYIFPKGPQGQVGDKLRLAYNNNTLTTASVDTVIVDATKLRSVAITEPFRHTNSDWKQLYGTQLDSYLGMLYLLKKHPAQCILLTNLLNKDMLKRSNAKNYQIVYTSIGNPKVFNVEMSNNLLRAIRECLDNDSVRFIYIPLQLTRSEPGSAVSGHANSIIIDKERKSGGYRATAEHFEPHGSSSNTIETLFDATTNLYPKLKDEFAKLNVLYEPPVITCPPESLQVFEFQGGKNDPRLTAVDPGGYCLMWSMFFTDLRLTNPDLSAYELQELVLIMDKTLFLEYIRNYSQFITKSVFDSLESENIEQYLIDQMRKKTGMLLKAQPILDNLKTSKEVIGKLIGEMEQKINEGSNYTNKLMEEAQTLVAESKQLKRMQQAGTSMEEGTRLQRKINENHDRIFDINKRGNNAVNTLKNMKTQKTLQETKHEETEEKIKDINEVERKMVYETVTNLLISESARRLRRKLIAERITHVRKWKLIDQQYANANPADRILLGQQLDAEFEIITKIESQIDEQELNT